MTLPFWWFHWSWSGSHWDTITARYKCLSPYSGGKKSFQQDEGSQNFASSHCYLRQSQLKLQIVAVASKSSLTKIDFKQTFLDSVYTLQVFVYLFKTTVSEVLAENYKQSQQWSWRKKRSWKTDYHHLVIRQHNTRLIQNQTFNLKNKLWHG